MKIEITLYETSTFVSAHMWVNVVKSDIVYMKQSHIDITHYYLSIKIYIQQVSLLH